MNALRIILFAKAPEPGFAKTRLIPALGADGAARLARRMLEATLASACAADVGIVELCVTPSTASGALRRTRIPPGVVITDQGEGDLGQRLARAANRCIEAGEAVLLVGADCLDLSPERLRAAANSLRTHDAVMHPAVDGGYTLLGLRRFDASVFTQMPWSTSSVAELTMARIQRLGWSVRQAATLRDIDEPEDLDHLPAAWESLR